MARHIKLGRTFRPIGENPEDHGDDIGSLFGNGRPPGITWDELLELWRVVVLAEPGTGKTEEFRETSKRLRREGRAAFLCRIESLQNLGLRESLDVGTAEELDAWIAGDDIAYIFLDSVDEARLSSRLAFEHALRRCAGELRPALTHARIFVSCRVSNWRANADRELVSRHLPSPPGTSIVESGPIEARTDSDAPVTSAMPSSLEPGSPWAVYQLAPLGRDQILEFARQSGVANPSQFVAEIESAHATIFVERPQDLLELIAFWSQHGRLGNHAKMIEFNVQKKLVEPNPTRSEESPLSLNEAKEGAERLAAALTFHRRSSILLPDTPVEPKRMDSALDPTEPLPEWPTDKTQSLLDRAIFDEAAYGTVQFHHRSVREYLAACWLRGLLAAGKSRRSIESLIFRHRYGLDVVSPSMRPVAAWLAVWDEKIRARLLSMAPEVLLEYGDPGSLPIPFREALLRSYASSRANQGSLSDLLDETMVRRMAHPELGPVINELIETYRHDHDTTSFLLRLVWKGCTHR